MMAVKDLVSVGIIEKDTRGDVLWTWAYPAVTEEEQDLYLDKCGLRSENENSPLQPFIYSQFRRHWHYIYSIGIQSTALPRVTHFSLVLTAKDFNPEKYEVLTSILAKTYSKTGSPVSLLESYLSVATKGTCNADENGKFTAQDYDSKQAYATSAVRDVIARFGIEVILLYCAMLLKRRVVFYHSNIEELLTFVRTLPAFVWHRQNWSIAFPYVLADGPEMSELKDRNHFVAGFTELSIQSRSELYDVFVNIATSEVTVSSHAKENFGLGKLHKELATFIVQCAEDEEKSDQQIIKEISAKTKELRNNLKSLATPDEDGNPTIQLEMLQARKMAAATETFLFNLAAAEGMVKI